MKKKRKKKNHNDSFSKSKLFDLVLAVFRKHPNKKLNYKRLSKVLAVKEMGVKIQILDVMKEMALLGVLNEGPVGSFKLIEKTTTLISTIKNTNNRGVYIEIDKEKEVFIPKESSWFALAGDEVEVFLFPKKKGRQQAEVKRVIARKKTDFVGVIDSFSSKFVYNSIPT